MRLKLFLNRLKTAKTTRVSMTSENRKPLDMGRTLPQIEKSELTALFKNVLKEKQDDLPTRRK